MKSFLIIAGGDLSQSKVEAVVVSNDTHYDTLSPISLRGESADLVCQVGEVLVSALKLEI